MQMAANGAAAYESWRSWKHLAKWQRQLAQCEAWRKAISGSIVAAAAGAGVSPRISAMAKSPKISKLSQHLLKARRKARIGNNAKSVMAA
jgi:hypothetical protein